jgi:26S proteasome regulatory subunit N1
MHRLGIAYAGSAREDVVELLLPAVTDTSVSMEIAAISSLALGFICTGSCNGDVAQSILQTMMEREEAELKDKWARFMALGLALLYLGAHRPGVRRALPISDARTGRQDDSDATLETLKAIEHPIAKQALALVDVCSYAGTGNVLKIQNLLHLCTDHIDPEKESDLHQAFAVIGIAIVAMGEDIGAEMALRQFNHLVSAIVYSSESY